MDETKTGEQLNDLQRWETLEGIEASHSSFYDEIYKKTELNAPQEVNFLIKALNLTPPRTCFRPRMRLWKTLY